ncbi:hypothetical protein C5167_048622 [Papaver somniferum]|uniref:FAS1 domain-containing protein n=1 Tax=Papaver somniferum TaxID=3469 RepID=A0A4Y7KLD0_PAPSO|nr:fasciclin-like arabinogalactan protein 8 [Papaver somniferum]RZC73140.1 hypothetical protein C5167_048622 [Papaver somniferum]
MAVSNTNTMIILMILILTLFSTTPLPTSGAAASHNITEILSKFPDYSVYNDYLTKTKVSDEINSRQTITVLVLNNGAMGSLTSGNHPLSVIKKALSLLVILDYFDAQKLHDISDGTTLSTTLYQTSGTAPGNLGFVNITDLKGGVVSFGSAAPGSKFDANYTKPVKQIPYSLSVLEISAPVIAPGILTAPNTSDVNITALLEKAGCKTFSSMLISSGVLKMYESSALDKGLTLFAPSDEAFKKDVGKPDLTKLSSAEIVTMLQYHAIPSYTPIGTLKTSKDHPISTLATNGAKKFELSVTSAGDSVTLNTGVDSSRVAGIVIDETPLCIFTVDDILLPVELFGTSPSPSPSLAPEPSVSDSPSSAPSPLSSDSPSSAPSPAPESADTPSPSPSTAPFASPPAPASGESPNGSPADSPDSSDDSSSDGKSHGVIVHGSFFKTLILTVSAGALLAWNL